MKRRSQTTWIELVINDEHKEIQIEYNYYAGCHGARGSFGEQLEPDDEPEIEILKAIDTENNDDILEVLTPQQIEKIEQKIYDIQSDYIEE